jgi:hypothetical protein
MTNKDMVPRPGPGPAPRDRKAPKDSKRAGGAGPDRSRATPAPTDDPPDSPQVEPSQDRK